MPVRNGKVGGGRTAASPQRRAGKATATKRKGKVRGYDARREAALAQVRDERDRLDAWIASQVETPVVVAQQRGPAVEEVIVDEPDGDLIEVHFGTLIETGEDDDLPMDVDSICKRLDWSMGEARHLVRQGYDIDHVVAITGWPASRLDDVRIGKWA